MDKRAHAKVDCYSAGERAVMVWGQGVRGRRVGPILCRISSWGVLPGHLTLLGLLAGLAFCPLWPWSASAALVALGLHVLLDGLDGTLARHQGVASCRGSLSDTTADQIVVAASTLTLMSDGTVAAPAGGTYIFLYTVVVAFAMVRNAMRVPYAWLVRPRLVVYAWLAVETWLLPGSIDYVLWLFNAVLAVKMASGFVWIRRKLGCGEAG